jgi:SET domain-containing protein
MALLEKWLRVRRSAIPKSGKGLFTTIDIAKGKRIVEYKGRLVKWKDVKYEDATNGYLLYITSQAVIDARPSKTFGRYANDARGFARIKGLQNNAEYVTEGTRCFIEATRNIKAGDEILVSYGKDYWKLDRETRKEKKLQSRSK